MSEPPPSTADDVTADSKGDDTAPPEVTFSPDGVKAGFLVALPIALGVAGYGIAFGVLADQAGLSTAEAALMSATVVAGASQIIAKYNLQVYTEEGWQEVRVGDEERSFGYTDEALMHPPGGGFEWSIELTESGIIEGAFHDHAEVCPDLQSGRYRFVFWGVIDGAVGVEFDLRV